MRSCPRRRSRCRPSAPVMDGQEDAAVYTGPALDLGRKWSGGACTPGRHGLRHRRAHPGDATSTYARVAVNGDNLYFFIHVRDDFQSYAVTPQECVAHWLADSVEILIDPRGNASQNNFDTGTTFKLGVFPFTNDPSNSNGNGVNGPCWERDADNHQGYATGPLAATVDAARRTRPACRSSRRRRGSARNRRRSTTATARPAATTSRSRSRWPTCRRRSGRPRARRRARGDEHDRPAAHGPQHHAVRRGQHGGGRHDDAAPHRPEHAARAGRTTSAASRPIRSAGATRTSRATRLRPAGRRRRRRRTCRTRTSTASLSPQTIYQSATDGVPISGRDPGAGGRQHHDRQGEADEAAAASAGDGPPPPTAARRVRDHATGPGTAHIFLWTGDHAEHPGVPVELRARERPAARLRLHAVRRDRRRHPAVVARHERSRRQAGRRRRSRRRASRTSRSTSTARSTTSWPRTARRSSRSRRRTTRCRRSSSRTSTSRRHVDEIERKRRRARATGPASRGGRCARGGARARRHAAARARPRRRRPQAIDDHARRR